MPALFFGRSSEPLYGVLEPPRSRSGNRGVLMLYPGLHEYMRAHWAFRTLAGSLIAHGFWVLRFDYRGTGDSFGGPELTTFEACVEDACVAANELRDAAGVDGITVIGMRLGAAVALHAASRLPSVRRIMLWNPVVDGRDYLKELAQLDRGMRLRLLLPLEGATGELAGYPFPGHVARSIESVDLRKLSLQGRPGIETVVDVRDPSAVASARELRASLQVAGHDVTIHDVDDGGGVASHPHAALLARSALAKLVARMTEGGA